MSFQGRYHHLDRAGINPLPVQRPIPVWMGGMAEPVLKRVAHIADGWFPQFQPGDDASHTLERMRAYMKEAGRPLSAVGIEGRFGYGIGGPTEWAKRAREWRDLGATHLSVNTMGAGLSARGHIDAILYPVAPEDPVGALQEFVGNFTYLGIFAVLLLGSLGVPIPEEMPIIAAAVLSHAGIVRWWLALPRLPAGGAVRRYGALLGRPALG